jgi:GNAT superfamily N-acetyltransferase
MRCAVGFPGRGDGFWWFGFDGALPRSVDQLNMSGTDFAFGDILVRPHPRDRGLARRVRERLLTFHQVPLAATSVDRATSAALRSWGCWRWLDIGVFRKPAGPTAVRTLVLPVGERTAARLEGLVTMPGGGGPGGP